MRVFLLGCWLMSCAGLQYSFSTYSAGVQESLRLTQAQIGVLALVRLLQLSAPPYMLTQAPAGMRGAQGKDIGAYFPLQGVFHDLYGARATLLAGGALILGGYLGLFALMKAGPGARPGVGWPPSVADSPVCSGTPPGALLWPGFGAICLASAGGSFLDMVCVMTLLHNASKERPLATGICKALLGLGASIFTSMYVAFLAPHASSYLLLCALLPPLIVGGAAPSFVKLERSPLHAARRSDCRTAALMRYLVWVFGLCAFIFLLVLLSIFKKHEGRALLRALTGVLLALLALPPALLARAAARAAPSGFDSEEECRLEAEVLQAAISGAAKADALDAPLLAESEKEVACDTAPAAPAEPPRLRGCASATLTLRQCLATSEFALLFAAMSAGTGGTLVLVNNLAQVCRSFHCANAPSYLSLFGVCSASGRLLTGMYGTRLPLPRPAFLLAALTALAGALAAAAAPSCGALYAIVAVVGHAFGCLFAFAPVVTGDLFGEANAGSMYGFVGCSPAVGSFCLNTFITGRVYGAHAHAASQPGDPPVCFGGACFRTTFLVSGGANLAGALAALVLLRRTRHMYT